jgi:tetratricopeptide (TPR) repeat protein
MTEKELRNIYNGICSNLASRRLKPAFDLLGKLILENGLAVFTDEYRNLEETYHYMLKYTVEGIRDPERQKVYRKLIVSVFSLADKVHEAVRLKISSSIEYEKKRIFREKFITDFSQLLNELEDFYIKDELLPDETSSPDGAKEHQEKIRRLFYHFWFRDKLSSEEAGFLRNFIMSPVILTAYKSFMVTAVMLSLQRFFDREKFTLLFDAYESEEVEISQRAIIGLLINLYRYDARLPFYPSVTGRLKILNENPEFKRNLERVILQFIRSKETEKLQQRIRDEILPEMIKISPHLKDKINLDSLMEEGLSEDKNPDWQEIFKDSPGLMNKMEEFSELQMEGADVFMGSFAMLKSFPFYSEMGNWFIPFFIENPEIARVLDLKDELSRRMLEAINRAPILCNSDKYSFCFSIQSLPKENREFMTQGINAEMDQLKEIEKDEELTNPGRMAEFISNQYIQDLYRFYKLFPRKGDFEDIFNWRFDFHNNFALGEILKEDLKVLRNIGEYYFAKNQYDEAAEIFSFLLEQKKDGELYQKIAFCRQKSGNYEKALDYYLKAELYDINRLWNLKKIALCYRNLKQPGKALEYYRLAEKIEPESLNNQLNTGHCLLELHEYEEALKCYFKVEYLAPGNKKVWRPIAWCSFLTGKKEQAEKYLLQLLEDEPGKHDLMNMGHVQWSMGKRKDALDFYRQSISEGGFSENEFLEVFGEDLPHLLSQGIDSDDVPIMLDQLRYFLGE